MSSRYHGPVRHWRAGPRPGRRGGSGLTKLAAAAALALVVACASGGGNRLSWNLGITTPNDAQTKSIEVFRQRRYEIERTTPPPALSVITHWRNRLPFEDERELGIEEARTRFIMEARPRSRSADPNRQDPYNVRLRAENQGRLISTGEFEPIATTPQFQAYAEDISRELRAVITMGIRGND